MLNLSAEGLNQMSAESVEKMKKLSTELDSINSEISQLNTKKVGVVKDLEVQGNKLQAVKRALILVQGVSMNVFKLRDKLLNKINREFKTDSISGRSKLQIEIKTIKEELTKICSHPFVFHMHGYEGSYSNDHEDGYPSKRYCVVCGFEERAKNLSGNAYLRVSNDFEILVDSSNRIIQNEPFRPYPESLKNMDIWIPFGAALGPFVKEVERILNS